MDQKQLWNMLFGAPLTNPITAEDACAESDAALEKTCHLLKTEVFGPEKNEMAEHVALEIGQVSKLPRDNWGLIARRAMFIFTFREREVCDAFQCDLATDLHTRVLPFFAPRFLRNSAQNPHSFIMAVATLCGLYRGDRLGNWPRELKE